MTHGYIGRRVMLLSDEQIDEIQNTIADTLQGADGGTVLEHGIEAGADAMLEVLKKQSFYSDDLVRDTSYEEWLNAAITSRGSRGWIIFIPEGESQDD